jgi:uncharacterized protein
MSAEVMESYIRQTIEAHSVPEITIAWQGGEPTLMGLDFYRLAAETAERYRKPGVTIQYTIQTNGILLDDPKNGSRPCALNVEVVIMVQHAQRRRGR